MIITNPDNYYGYVSPTECKHEDWYEKEGPGYKSIQEVRENHGCTAIKKKAVYSPLLTELLV